MFGLDYLEHLFALIGSNLISISSKFAFIWSLWLSHMNAHEFKVIVIIVIFGTLYDLECWAELGLIEETISMCFV